ncbi:ABC transporter ATP-binding protein [Arvimicrobium flavum]|uniref:ABC transporter ATP-binding protein n=1 Tax=Arvimicrobium flavum TaxID=3393320 RepID=UPI00237A1043|nr:ABC transporter ATP-binding protein [Mesorhizobium shangrilense]
MSGKTVTLTDVAHWFAPKSPGDKPVQVLRKTDLVIKKQEFVALVGPSGCGKTTVLNMVAGLIDPFAGSVRLDGQKPKVGDRDVGYLLARDALMPWRTAVQNVSLPLELRGISRRKAEDAAAASLKAVGLGAFINSYPAQLSHGMRQRVAVARTLVTEPTTVLMDEPFSALDAQTRLSLQQQFLSLWERLNSTVLFVTHDLTEAILMADRVLVFSARPGAIKADFKIELERPRSLSELQGSDKFHALFQEIWNVFRDEVQI